MASISERENREIEAANASGNTPVVFVHGLWLLPSSWASWADFFKQAGYAPLTPDWPGDPETVDQARANPDVLAKKTLKQIADHTAGIINALDKKPAVMGHSTGGLLAQMLAGRGLAAVTVAIDPGDLPRRSASAGLRAQGGGPVPGQPAHPRPRDHAHLRPVHVRLGERPGRAGGEGALRHVPRRRLRDLSRADGQREPQPVDGGEGQYDEPRPRSPAHHRGREGPHGAPGRSRTPPTSGSGATPP
jgi:pimeloyl-ACP methyl ester carboxylesterase